MRQASSVEARAHVPHGAVDGRRQPVGNTPHTRLKPPHDLCAAYLAYRAPRQQDAQARSLNQGRGHSGAMPCGLESVANGWVGVHNNAVLLEAFDTESRYPGTAPHCLTVRSNLKLTITLAHLVSARHAVEAPPCTWAPLQLQLELGRLTFSHSHFYPATAEQLTTPPTTPPSIIMKVFGFLAAALVIAVAAAQDATTTASAAASTAASAAATSTAASTATSAATDAAATTTGSAAAGSAAVGSTTVGTTSGSSDAAATTTSGSSATPASSGSSDATTSGSTDSSAASASASGSSGAASVAAGSVAAVTAAVVTYFL
ncbi:hypothetical protein PHYSODRAFT_305048 [Phytophthora sojae]|uniref:Uncharacterized protein n=1 Tax=Phytophthora sojae (strain P6497) TaxID=1094619 RepID=G5A4D9_PHYSP|nr:hypothetical protein PHYSODRAFT_305048 [Phytophthora sojae]EGZ09540.1 hypothetical protein PHYSODRAFT_305048 [Phytophthora sojae]|eukprot:XP_009534401.1 hypothetical protein PHYSODRAFT_305048 [Phytophthora sojae]